MTQAHGSPAGKPGGSAAAEWTIAIAIWVLLVLGLLSLRRRARFTWWRVFSSPSAP